ncbi:hypothetical protein [Cyclobacterium jeungdonense]|uniref:Uncharacterized protein n=1 Tax=Cyclobacterium jeungdonense TaxID=708087 RepID=A0ABT8CDJ7_9BACT|nr:hypothetical protein [Cyclobacterium jeungdonense]MDN3690486.1 hypothetical protein [Cyclobacterium jeungdonense]
MSDKQELFLVFFLGLMAFIIWNLYYDSYDKLYTVGIVEKKQIGLKSGTVVKFNYSYNGRKYEGGTGIGDYNIKIGERYIVEFAKDKVDLSKALFYYPIPDSVRVEIPLDGWKEVPSELKRYRRKRMELFGLYDIMFKN